MPSFSIIVAMDKKRGIGISGRLPWSLPGDMKYFKEITSQAVEGKQNALIMGRKTWESIPESFRPLKGRINVVLTRNQQQLFPSGVECFGDFESALNWLFERQADGQIDRIFVIGGQQLFEAALERLECELLYVTDIDDVLPCDTFFPPFEEKFSCQWSSSQHSENSLNYHFCVYKKR